MSSKENLTIEIVSKEILTAEIVEKELIDVELYVVDIVTGIIFRNISEMEDVALSSPVDGQILVLEGGVWVNKTVSVIIDTYAVHNEVPTNVNPLPSKQFQTAEDFRSETLKVYLNGILEKNITVVDDNTFEFLIDIESSDEVLCDYIKQ